MGVACLAVSWHHGLCCLLCLLFSVAAGPHGPGGSWRLPLSWGSAGDVSEELEASRRRVGLEGFSVPLLLLRRCQVTWAPCLLWACLKEVSLPFLPPVAQPLGLECGSEEGPSDPLLPSGLVSILFPRSLHLAIPRFKPILEKLRRL